MATTIELRTTDASVVAALRESGFRLLAPDSDPDSKACLVLDGRHVAPDEVVRGERPYVVLVEAPDRAAIDAWVDAGARDVIDWPCSSRELAVRVGAIARRKVKIACIGGGTGLFHLLLGLKVHADVLLSSIVAMSDDGGSSGRLRADFGILPPGDVRRSLVALSDAPRLMNEVVQHRFTGNSAIAGHSLGNLVLTALSEIEGSFGRAVRALADILHLRGIVSCVTTDDTTLCAEMVDGTIVRSESAIDVADGRSPSLRIRRVWLEPTARCTTDAYTAIKTSDAVVIGPGDLYTSIIANLVVEGIPEALRSTTAQIVYVCNLMTKPGETPDYSTADHVRALVSHLGFDPFDVILASGGAIDPGPLSAYADRGQHPVRGELDGSSSARLVLADVSDPERLVRHDPHRLATAVRDAIAWQPSSTIDLRGPL